MSHPYGKDPEKGHIIGGHFVEPPQSLPILHHPPQGESGFGDKSRSLFTMYSKLAEEDDNKMAERWQKDAEGIIIFNGLFSAVVAALVVLSIADLKPDQQERSAFYLEQIYRLEFFQTFPNDPNNIYTLTNTSTPAQYSASSPTYAIWVNSLWLLSLAISLTCAMLATSVQQWARRYIRLTQPARTTPKQRARMRAFFANGVDQFHVSWAVETLPALVHLALVIFFSGLLIYLFHTNRIVFYVVLGWIGISGLVYAAITLMPIIRPDSPFYAPLSSTAWFVYSSLQDVFGGCRCEAASVLRAAEEAAREQSPEIDVRILDWTVDALGEDDAQEKFFESLPGFYRTDIVRDPVRGLPEEIEWKILGILNEFLRRSLSSSSITGLVKSRRFSICLNVACEVRSPLGIRFLCRRVIEETNWSLVPESVDIGQFLRSWDKSTKGQFTQYIQGVIAHIVAGVWERNDGWMKLAKDHVGMSEDLLQDYLSHGDSILLANLIHLTRLLSRTDWVTLDILRPLTRFDVHNTHTGAQNDFCAMWNELVLESRSRSALSRLRTVLKAIRPIFIDLHPQAQETGASQTKSRYQLCTNTEHRSGWTTQDVRELSVLDIGDLIHPHASTSASATGQHPSRASASASAPAAIASSSLPASHSDHAIPPLVDEPSPSDLPGPSAQSSHQTHHVPPPDHAISIDSAVIISESPQSMASSPDLPSMAMSDPRSIAIATTHIQEQAVDPLSVGTDPLHDRDDRHLVTPSTPPEVPISPRSSDALPTDTQQAASTASQSDVSHLVAENPLPETASIPPPTTQQEPSDSRDDLQDPDIPSPTATSQHSHHSTQSLPDITGDPPIDSPDTPSSPHDSGHSHSET